MTTFSTSTFPPLLGRWSPAGGGRLKSGVLSDSSRRFAACLERCRAVSVALPDTPSPSETSRTQGCQVSGGYQGRRARRLRPVARGRSMTGGAWLNWDTSESTVSATGATTCPIYGVERACVCNKVLGCDRFLAARASPWRRLTSLRSRCLTLLHAVTDCQLGHREHQPCPFRADPPGRTARSAR